ncbi:MAG: hypothetical protein AABX11_07205 [Nanoarchaeota archaeon]
MYPGEFERLFKKVSDLFTLESIAQKLDLEDNFPKRRADTLIWDTIDSSCTGSYIDIGDGKYVLCNHLLKRPVRILFFILLSEFESRLFRIHEWKGKDIDYLNEKNINDLIKELVDSDLIQLQREYKTRQEFKEDLKAVSSFRNVIMHVNKKLEKTVDLELVIKRKAQVLKLLLAFQQILDNMERSYEKKNNSLNNEQLKELKENIGSLEDSIKIIYSSRKIRPLIGKDSIYMRTFGEDFVSPEKYNPEYLDERRGRKVKTEFAEIRESLNEYDKKPSQKNKIRLLLEVGDFIVQTIIINQFYSKDKLYFDINKTAQYVLNFLKLELKKRGFEIEMAEKLARIKYGSRAWLRKKGLPPKDKQLEESLCKEEVEKFENVD